MSIARSVGSIVLSTIMALAWVPATQAPAGAVAGQEPGTADPSPSPSIAPGGPSEADQEAGSSDVWLRGPFGRVAGATPAQPATASPWGGALDTFVRRAPLVIEADEALGSGQLLVVARSVAGAAPDEVLSTGATAFAGPDRVGQSVLVASLVGAAGETSEAAWLVDVPDRTRPADGLLDIPAPEVIVASSTAQLAGRIGDGCYAYLCVDVGRPPSVSTLEPLPVALGEVLSLRLGDGSAITAWDGSLSPIAPTRGEMLQAGGALTDSLEPVLSLPGLEPPSAGGWLLSLKVVLDRERGWLITYHRLEAR